MWGTGLGAVIELPAPWPDHLERVGAVLSGLKESLLPSSAVPVAFAALPFDRSQPGRFFVPHYLRVQTEDGEQWEVILHSDPLPDSTIQRGFPTEPSSYTVTAEMAVQHWCDTIGEATQAIASGALDKVVLARSVLLSTDKPLSYHQLGALMAAAQPSALRYCIDGFFGASPELLVSRLNEVVRAQPMAGTLPRSGDPSRDAQRAAELLASEKNRWEHQITIDMVHKTLLPWCSYLDAEPQPQVVGAGSVQHLATMVEGRLSAPLPSVLELMAALHPTPAVGGSPTQAALQKIAELEPVSRGRYGGPVGWVDADGNGAWAVGLRGGEATAEGTRLFAGVGIVEDSDPDTELAETRAKFASTLASLIRP